MYFGKINSKNVTNVESLELLGPSLFLTASIFLLVIRNLFASFLSLSDTRSGIISTATYNGIDINNRINTFYYKLFIVAALFLLMYKFVSWVRDTYLPGRIFKVMSFVSFLGTVLLVPSFFSNPGLIVVFFLLLVLGIGLSFLKHRKLETDKIAGMLLIAVTLLFVCKNPLTFLFAGRNEPLVMSLLLVVFTGILYYPFFWWADKNIVLFRTLILFLIIFPILNIIGDELFSVFYFRGKMVVHPAVFKIVLFVSLAIIFYRGRNFIRNLSQRKFYDHYFYPVLALSFSLLIHYSFFIVQDKEVFELANPGNAMMRLFQFGEIPLLEAYSSHLLCEQYFGILYNLLHGYDASLSFLCYKFLDNVIVSVIGYYFLLWITGRGWMAILILLFFSYIDILVASTYILALVSVRLLQLLFEKYSRKRLVYLILWSVLLVFWRLDLGIANTIAVGFMVLFLLVQKKEIQVVKELLVSVTLVLAGLLALFGVLYSISAADLIHNLAQILDYVKSSIAHGYTDVANQMDRYYFIFYQLFPFLVTILLILLLLNYQKAPRFKRRPDYFLLLMFLSLYYLFNAQRGLVRHSFMELNDTFISSFVFLIISLIGAYLLAGRAKVIWFLGIGVILVITFGYTDSSATKNNMDLAVARMPYKYPNPMHLVKTKTRVEEDTVFSKENYTLLKELADKKFEANATFIDFSNTPMLYYYLQRPVPSVFNQYMQNTVSPYLQKENIRGLSSYDIPFVVYSNYPKTWFDETDGVPNALRYYHTVNYIYNHYKPWGVLNKHSLWIRKDLEIGSDTLMEDSSFASAQENLHIRKLAYLLGNTKEEFVKEEIPIDPNKVTVLSETQVSVQLPKGIQKKKGNWLVLEIENREGAIGELSVGCTSASDSIFNRFLFETKEEKGKSFYLFPVSSFYSWHLQQIEKIIVSLPSEKYRLVSVRYTESL